MLYAVLKHLHVTTAALTVTLLVLRGRWRITGDTRLRARWARIVPHVNDTVLLASALAMLLVAHLDPLRQPWLLAKLAALVVYVLLGLGALRIARTPGGRALALGAALAAFLYIVAVAWTKRPLPWG